MNLKKEISSRLSGTPSYRTDNSGAVVGVIAGLAVGAALGILFAPDSGRKMREQISDKALGFTGNMKDGLIALKEQLAVQKDNIMGLKDRLVHNMTGKSGGGTQGSKESENGESRNSDSVVDTMAENLNNPAQRI